MIFGFDGLINGILVLGCSCFFCVLLLLLLFFRVIEDFDCKMWVICCFDCELVEFVVNLFFIKGVLVFVWF